MKRHYYPNGDYSTKGQNFNVYLSLKELLKPRELEIRKKVYEILQKYVKQNKNNMETYKKAGCNECVHGTSKWGWVDDKYTVVERKCLMGNTDKLIKWWEDNGSKRTYEGVTLDEMDCHEYHESTKTLIDMNNSAEKLLKLLKEK